MTGGSGDVTTPEGPSSVASVDSGQLGGDLGQERYRQLIDRSPNAICVHEAGRVVYVNAAGLRWLGGTSTDQIVGHPITEFIHADSVPQVLDRVARLTKIGDSSEPSETTVVRFDGTVLVVEAVSVLMVWDGRPAYQVAMRDLSAQKAAEAALRCQAVLVEHVSDAIIGITHDGLITMWSPGAEAMYDRPAADVMGTPIAEAVGAEVNPVTIIGGGGTAHTTHKAADGSARAVRVCATSTGENYLLVCSGLSLPGRAEQHFENVVTSLDEGIIVVDRLRGIKSINPAALKMLPLTPQHLRADLESRDERFPLYDAAGKRLDVEERPVSRVLATGLPVSQQIVGFDWPDGRRQWLSCSCRLLNPDDSDHSDIVMSFSDVTAARNAAEQLAHQANHDLLTGLPNRAHVLSTIGETLTAPGESVLRAVLYIDLDDLKLINDTMGHDAGDEHLRAAAQRLVQAISDGDVVGRLGGDEFVVLIFGTATRAELEDLADQLHAQLAQPWHYAGTASPIRASIGGVELTSRDQRTVSEILRDADLAMYEAKKAGRSQSRWAHQGSRSAGRDTTPSM